MIGSTVPPDCRTAGLPLSGLLVVRTPPAPLVPTEGDEQEAGAGDGEAPLAGLAARFHQVSLDQAQLLTTPSSVAGLNAPPGVVAERPAPPYLHGRGSRLGHFPACAGRGRVRCAGHLGWEPWGGRRGGSSGASGQGAKARNGGGRSGGGGRRGAQGWRQLPQGASLCVE